MNAPTFTKAEWEAAVQDKGIACEAPREIVEALESINDLVKSIDLSIKLATAGIKIDYEFSTESKSLQELVAGGLKELESEFLVDDALSSIIPQ